MESVRARTAEEWAEFCATHIKGGFVAGHSKRGLYAKAVASVDALRPLSLWRPGNLILDLGCGTGRMAMGLLNDPIRYMGIDCVRAAIEFCKEAFAEERPDFQFIWQDVGNQRYNKTGNVVPTRARIPLGKGTVDLLYAKSFFTHQGPCEVARHYIKECQRALRPGGLFYSTWFTSPPNARTESEARTVYGEAQILALLSEGFTVELEADGLTTSPNDQRVIIARRNDA